MRSGGVSLRWAVPLGLAIVFLLILGLSLYSNVTNQERLYQGRAKIELLNLVNDLARIAGDSDLARNDLLASSVSQIAGEPRVTHVLVLDEQGRILASQRYDWLGRKITEVMPTFDIKRADRLFNGGPPHLHSSDGGVYLSAMRSFYLAPRADRVRSPHRGLVYISFDLKDALAHIRRNSLIGWLPEAGFMLVMIVLVGLMMNRHLTQPLRGLMQATDRLRRGNYQVSVPENGPSEVHGLAKAFNAMVQTLDSAQSALSSSQRRLSITLNSIGDGLIATDLEARITLMNPVAEELTGWRQDEAQGLSIDDVVVIRNGMTGAAEEVPVHEVLRNGKKVELANHTILFARNGRTWHIADSSAPIRDDKGELQGVVLVFRDMSEQYQLREALAESERHFRTLINSGQALMWTSGLDRRRNYFNDVWLRFTGRTLEQELGAGWMASVHPDDLVFMEDATNKAFDQEETFAYEYRLRHHNGRYHWLFSQGGPRYDTHGNFIGLVGQSLDITAAKETEAELERLAYRDTLTGLPNRALLMDRLGQILTATRHERRFGGLLLIDLDRFKHLNDVYGHSQGDAVIREVARRLEALLQQEDTIARLGGDEFVVLLAPMDTSFENAGLRALTLAEDLRRALEQPIRLGQDQYSTSASTGITLFPKDEVETAEDLLREAEIALYQAKENGRNTLAHFESSMQEAVTQRYQLEQELQDAVREDQFELYLQSQVDARGRLLGGEVLIRWQHPDRGIVSPADFIPIAEESGLIIPIGERVLREACTVLAGLQAEGRSSWISVNVSPRQFRDPGFVERTRSIIQETGVAPQSLMLEITENLLVSNTSEVVARMNELAALGVRFSIDDFGTGYSSMAYLKRMPLSELKIDKGFVQDVASDPNDAALVEAILAMAHHLGFEVVAEGVEDEQQLNFLAARGCQRFQGYFFHRSMPLTGWIEAIRSAA